LGGTCTIDKMKLFAGYEHLSAADDPVATDATKLNHYWIGANYAITPALILVGAVYHANLNNNGGGANLFLVGANYNLSKRTLLYADIGTMRNSGNAISPPNSTTHYLVMRKMPPTPVSAIRSKGVL
jgi:predicted porin